MRLLLVTFTSSALALAPRPMPERVWAIGDLHGDAGCAHHWLKRTGLIANMSAPMAEWTWADTSSQLVFMGDYIDRGPEAQAVLKLVSALTTRFPRHVHALLGNHELNLLVDRARRPGGGRYLEFSYAAAHPAQYAAWLSGDEPSDTSDIADVRQALSDALLTVYRKRLYDPNSGVLMTPDGPRSIVQYVQPHAARKRVADALRRWQAAYMHGVRPSSELGAWILRPLTVVLADTLFVHGGIYADLLSRDLPATPISARRPLGSLDALAELNVRWQNVTRAGRVGRLAPRAGESEVEADSAASHALSDSALVEYASELVEYRGLHESYAGRYSDRHSRQGATALQVGCERVSQASGPSHRLPSYRIVSHRIASHRIASRPVPFNLSAPLRSHPLRSNPEATPQRPPHPTPPHPYPSLPQTPPTHRYCTCLTCLGSRWGTHRRIM